MSTNGAKWRKLSREAAPDPGPPPEQSAGPPPEQSAGPPPEQSAGPPPEQSAGPGPRPGRRRTEVNFRDSVVIFQSDGGRSGQGSTELLPPNLITDRESSTTLSSIWDIEVEVEPVSLQLHASQKKAPLAKWR